MNQKELKIINDKFLKLVEDIPTSYMYLDDRQEIIDSCSKIEIARVMLRKYSKEFKEGEISLEEFKEDIIRIVTNETDQMIVVDENRNEITDEEKTMQNYISINSYDENEIKEFVKRLYRILSSARFCLIHKLNPEATILVAGRDESSSLNVF